MLERFSNVVYWLSCILAVGGLFFVGGTQLLQTFEYLNWKHNYSSVEKRILQKCQNNDDELESVLDGLGITGNSQQVPQNNNRVIKEPELERIQKNSQKTTDPENTTENTKPAGEAIPSGQKLLSDEEVFGKQDLMTDEQVFGKQPEKKVKPDTSNADNSKKPWDRYRQQPQQEIRKPVDLLCIKREQESQFYKKLGDLIPISLMSFAIFAFGWAFRYVLAGKK